MMKRQREEDGDDHECESPQRRDAGAYPSKKKVVVPADTARPSTSSAVVSQTEPQAKPVLDRYVWLRRYQSIAPVVKLRCQLTPRGDISDYILPSAVAFYTKNHPSKQQDAAVRTEYIMGDKFRSLSKDSMEQEMRDLGVNPELAEGTGVFDDVLDYIDKSGFLWTDRPDQGEASYGWVINNENVDLSVFNGDETTLDLLRAFKVAHTLDMANGPGKLLMNSLFSYLKCKLAIQSNSQPTFLHYAPSEGMPTNVILEYVSTKDPSWNLPYDPARSPEERRRSHHSGRSSTSSTGSGSRCRMSPYQTCLIPDYVLMLPAPRDRPESIGEFLLSIENKKITAAHSTHSSVVQCTRHMLGQMHMQSFALGLVMCHGEWSLIILRKDHSVVPQCIRFCLYSADMFSTGTARVLDIKSVKMLFNWLYAILAWKTM